MTKTEMKKRNRIEWTKEQDELLKKLYTTATWTDLDKAFPGRKRGAIVAQAVRLGLKRPPKAAKNEPTAEDQIVQFMTHGQSASEVALKFGMTVDEAKAKFRTGFAGYDLCAGPLNIRKEQTFVAVPKTGNIKVPERVWSWQREDKQNQPYGVITFPDDYNHKKIRIVPLDRVLFGDDAHDAARFDAVIRQIARDPNTFCFLNGDIIAPIAGGKKEVREALLIERAVEFEKKMRPVIHKILWAEQGCLEEESQKRQSFDPLQHFCEKYGVPYFAEPVYIDIFWKNQMFTLWAMHGQSAAQLKGTKINSLRRPAQVHEFTNFIMRGHLGDAMWNRQIKVCRDPILGTLSQMEEFHIILGGFAKYFGTREARRGIQPSSCETIVLYLYPDGAHHVKTLQAGRK